MSLLSAKNISKTFSENRDSITAVDSFSYDFPNNGVVCFIGESGSGKTTLLHLLSRLENPDDGEIYINGENTVGIDQTSVSKIRNQYYGFVFQENNLLEKMTVGDNLRLVSLSESDIDSSLKDVGLLNKKDVIVSKLSGGEKQRVSIARSILKKSKIIVFDEPTASLDSKNSVHVFEIIKEISKAHLCLISTHNTDLANKYSDVLFSLKDGKATILKENKENNSDQTEENVTSEKGRLPLFYGWSSIWRRKGKAVFSFILSTLAMLIATLGGSVVFFDEENSFRNALNQENIWAISLKNTEYNEPTNEYRTWSGGKYLYECAETAFERAFPMIDGYLSSPHMSLYIMPYFQSLKIRGTDVLSPAKGECVVSSLLSSISKDKISFRAQSRYSSAEVSLTYKQIIDVDYDMYTVNLINTNDDYQSKNQDDFIEKYAFVVMNSEEFYSLFSTSSSMWLPASSFLSSSSLTLKQYAELDKRYAPYKGKELLKGRKINAKNEVIVTTSYLRQMYIDEKDYDSILEKTYSFRDLSASPNYVLYRCTFNPYEICNSVKIVGIIKSEESDVCVSAELYNSFAKELIYYSGSICGYNSDSNLSAKILSQNVLKTDLSHLQPIYSINGLKEGPFLAVLICLESLLCLVVIFTGFSIGSECVSGKEKENALLLTLGYESKDLLKRYLFGGLLFQLSAFIVSLGVSFGAVAIINNALMAKDIFGISYSLLSVEWSALLIGVLAAMLSVFASSFVYLKRLSHIQISDIFRGKE